MLQALDNHFRLPILTPTTAPLAQLAEQLTLNQRVPGSSPGWRNTQVQSSSGVTVGTKSTEIPSNRGRHPDDTRKGENSTCDTRRSVELNRQTAGMPSNRARPSPPRTDFPLQAYNNGQWGRKIKGVRRYFGVWADAKAAEALCHPTTVARLLARMESAGHGIINDASRL